MVFLKVWLNFALLNFFLKIYSLELRECMLASRSVMALYFHFVATFIPVSSNEKQMYLILCRPLKIRNNIDFFGIFYGVNYMVQWYAFE
jgi:hypothetical protein